MNLCIGFLELNSIAKGIEAADRILKTAETRLLFAKAGRSEERRVGKECT